MFNAYQICVKIIFILHTYIQKYFSSVYIRVFIFYLMWHAFYVSMYRIVETLVNNIKYAYGVTKAIYDQPCLTP